jgi:hypothetical protein
MNFDESRSSSISSSGTSGMESGILAGNGKRGRIGSTYVFSMALTEDFT